MNWAYQWSVNIPIQSSKIEFDCDFSRFLNFLKLFSYIMSLIKNSHIISSYFNLFNYLSYWFYMNLLNEISNHFFHNYSSIFYIFICMNFTSLFFEVLMKIYFLSFNKMLKWWTTLIILISTWFSKLYNL